MTCLWESAAASGELINGRLSEEINEAELSIRRLYCNPSLSLFVLLYAGPYLNGSLPIIEWRFHLVMFLVMSCNGASISKQWVKHSTTSRRNYSQQVQEYHWYIHARRSNGSRWKNAFLRSYFLSNMMATLWPVQQNKVLYLQKWN